MKVVIKTKHIVIAGALTAATLLGSPATSFARDIEYKSGQGEIEVYVNPGEPTEIVFPGTIGSGFKNSNAGVAIERKDSSLIIFGKENIKDDGEALLVRLQDGRSYPVRVRRASDDNPRDAQLMIGDGKGPMGGGEEEDEFTPYKERGYDYAPPSKVSGLMREMVLVAEFGKKSIPGYTVSEKFKGQTVVDDGAVLSKIDKIFIGPNLWGYVLDTTNLLDQTQKVNPASFRIDGTRAVSASNWELSPRPVNVEEQVASKHNSKVYIVTRAR
jgi:hypothetical protein